MHSLVDEDSFLKKYRHVLGLLKLGQFREDALFKGFVTESRKLFESYDKSDHVDLWNRTGLKDFINDTHTDSCVLLSLCKSLIPVLESSIISEDVGPRVQNVNFDKKSPLFTSTLYLLIEVFDFPTGFIESNSDPKHPLYVKYQALNFLKNPSYSCTGDITLILRHILGIRPPPDKEHLIRIGKELPEDDTNPEYSLLKTLFANADRISLTQDYNLKSYEDALKYFSSYKDLNSLTTQTDLLKNYANLLDSEDSRTSRIVLDGLSRYGEKINREFVRDIFVDLLNSYLEKESKPATRDCNVSDRDRKFLSCLLEVSRKVFCTEDLTQIQTVINSLILSPTIQVDHRVACIELLTNLISVHDDYRLSSDIWFRLTSAREWEILESLLHLLVRLIILEKWEENPPLKYFLRSTLRHENCYVRAATLNVYNALLKEFGLKKFLEDVEVSTAAEFLKPLFKEESEAVVRRQCAVLAGNFDFSIECGIRQLLLDIIRNDSDWEVKEIVIDIWGKRMSDEQAIDAFEIAKMDPEKRQRQKALQYLDQLGLQPEGVNCFDDFVNAVYGFDSLLNDILQTENDSYKVYDLDCF